MQTSTNHLRSNAEAAELGVVLGVIAALFLPVFGGATWMVFFVLQFVLPIPVCLCARTRLLPLSLIPNVILNCWFIFVQAPRSDYWAGWRNEWADSLIVFGLGVAASSIVAALIIGHRRVTEKH